MTDAASKPKCFIAMPITTHDEEASRYGGDREHWKHVMEHLFVPAIEEAGYEPIRPVTKGSSMIHGEIVKHLSEAEMVLCDFSGLNANVFFELGVRTSLDLPVALVKDEHTKIPFDLGGMNTHEYKSTIDIWSNKTETAKLTTHIKDCHDTCKGTNPLWQRFGLTITAEEPSSGGTPLEAKLDLLLERTEPGPQSYYGSFAELENESLAEKLDRLSKSDTFSKRAALGKQSAALKRFQLQVAEVLAVRVPEFEPLFFHSEGGLLNIVDTHNEIPEEVRDLIEQEAKSKGLSVSFPPF